MNATKPTTPLAQLEALAKLREKATHGPWRDAGHGEITAIIVGRAHAMIAADVRGNDADFLALASTIDLPALVRYVRALEHVVEVARLGHGTEQALIALDREVGR